jgi:hypothetical protein
MRNALILLLTATGSLCFAQAPRDGYQVPKDKQKRFAPIDSAELIRRYPEGKKWKSMSVFRGTGTATSTNWGLEGEVDLVLTNQYVTKTEVLKRVKVGSLSQLTLRCEILEASATKVFTKRRLRLADLGSNDPLFDLAANVIDDTLEDAVPGYKILKRAGKLVEGADPKLERTLTSFAKRLGLKPDALVDRRDLQLIESPDKYRGRSFRVTWMNGFGVVQVIEDEPKGQRGRLDLNDLRQYSLGVNPLADLYIFPSLKKQKGDRWTLDASRASSIFVGRGDASTSGKVELRYKTDGKYGSRTARMLGIEAGNIKAYTDDDGDAIEAGFDSMVGDMAVSNQDGLLLMANGTGKLTYERISKDHILFKARISKNFKAQWRYEASRLDK